MIFSSTNSLLIPQVEQKGGNIIVSLACYYKLSISLLHNNAVCILKISVDMGCINSSPTIPNRLSPQ